MEKQMYKKVDGTVDRQPIFYITQNNRKGLSAVPSNEIELLECIKTIFPEECNTEKKTRRCMKHYPVIPTLIQHFFTQHHRLNSFQLLNHTCPSRSSGKYTTDRASTKDEVAHFLISHLKRVISPALWGDTGNERVLFRAVRRYICLHKGMSFSVCEILHSFKITTCHFLSSKSSRLVPSELEKKKRLLKQWMFWLFSSYMNSLLRTYFYITEQSKKSKEIAYFRQDVFMQSSQSYFHMLMEDHYLSEIHSDQLSRLSLGVANVRLIPKKGGFRMITNMHTTRKYTFNHTNQYDISPFHANQQLKPVLDILHQQKRLYPGLFGSSVVEKDGFTNRLNEFKKKMTMNDEKLYFVKVDVKDCFDNMDQERLLNIIDTRLNFSFYPLKKAKEIRELLEEVICHHVIKFGNKYYKRRKGIPQGCCLSTFLCCLYHGHLENEKMSFINADKTGLFMTYIDDFLYITKDIDYANRFLKVVEQGFTDYNWGINHNKTLSNINEDIEVFTWLGYHINTKTLDHTQP